MGELRRGLRRRAHRILARCNGGGVPVRSAPGWRLAVAPDGYEDLRYWLRYEAATFAVLHGIWRPGMAVLDVGAHHGVFSVCCCPRGRRGEPPTRVLAVEPSPEALPLLRANAGVQRAEWIVEPAAASDRPGTLRFYPGLIHMLVAAPELHGAAGNTPPVEVAADTLDAICARHGFTPDLIKIDVEGFEREALEGARGLLASARPRVILEWHCAMLRARGLDAVAALAPLAEAGYRFEPYERPGLGAVAGVGLSSLPPQDIYRLLCTPAAS
jgi:FkbM family methyltransferase